MNDNHFQSRVARVAETRDNRLDLPPLVNVALDDWTRNCVYQSLILRCKNFSTHDYARSLDVFESHLHQ